MELLTDHIKLLSEKIENLANKSSPVKRRAWSQLTSFAYKSNCKDMADTLTFESLTNPMYCSDQSNCWHIQLCIFNSCIKLIHREYFDAGINYIPFFSFSAKDRMHRGSSWSAGSPQGPPAHCRQPQGALRRRKLEMLPKHGGWSISWPSGPISLKGKFSRTCPFSIVYRGCFFQPSLFIGL